MRMIKMMHKDEEEEGDDENDEGKRTLHLSSDQLVKYIW